MLTLVLIMLMVGVALGIAAGQKRFVWVRYLAPRLLVSYITLVALLGMGELYFRYVYAESGWGFTLAYQNWEKRYWETNSFGFRDREWAPSDWADKNTIMVLGDSFSAGWGIQNPEDRYPDVLATLLGDDYAVVNLSRPGGTPRRELEWAKDHPLQNPDTIIYQYYLNDIDDAALEINDFWAPQFPEPPHWIHKESYLANFLYWRIIPSYRGVHAPDGQSYWDWNYATFQNYGIFERHRTELENVIAFAEERDARLIIVIFPNMHDPVGSIRYVDAVAGVFIENGHTDVLRLYDAVAGWKSGDIVVSVRDAHPSAAFHHRVAQLLYEGFFSGAN